MSNEAGAVSEDPRDYEDTTNTPATQYFDEVAVGAAGINPITKLTPAFAPYQSTAGYRDLGGSAPYMDPVLLKRPARKQVYTINNYI